MEDTIAKLPEIERSKKIDMGPRWSVEELDIFLTYFRKSQLTELDEIRKKLQECGFDRTIENLVSIYLKNKNFLTINKTCTAQDLTAIMADYYETIEQEVINVIPKRVPGVETDIYNQKIQYDQQIEVRDFYNYNLASGNSGKKRKPQIKGKISTDYNQINEDNQHENRKILKIRNVDFNSNNYDLQQLKAKRKSKIQKGKNLILQENDPEKRIKTLEQMTRQCGGNNPKKLQKRGQEISNSYIRWVENEYFYSHIDKPYFMCNEFKDMLRQVGLDNIGKVTRKEWNLIRKAMGKPRKFSQKFIKKELDKLHNYRDIVRNFLKNQNYNIDQPLKNKFIVQEVKKMIPLNVGQQVIGLHPTCNHFHCGKILTTNWPFVIVKFLTNELGVHKIQDIKLSPEFAQIQSYEESSTKKSSETKDILPDSKNLTQQNILQGLDLYSMAFLFKLLDKKTILINELRNFNEQAEKHQETVNEQFLQEYGWTGVQINLIDEALKHVIAKFRLRGLNNDNIGIVQENFTKIIKTPIETMEQELIYNQDPKNQETLQLIKHNNSKYNEEKIQKDLDELIYNTDQKVEINEQELDKQDNGEEESEEKKQLRKIIQDDLQNDVERERELKHLVKNCLGVLMTLKQSGDINQAENKFIKGISDSIYIDHLDQFHEINDAILNITSKFKQISNRSSIN